MTRTGQKKPRSPAARRRKGAVRFRLTLAGWLFILAAVLVGVVALNSRLALLFALFGCMLGALHVSAVLSRRMIAGAEVRRQLPRRCWQNERLARGYLLRARPGGGACLAVRVDELGAAAAAMPTVHCGHVPARGDLWTRGELTPSRRGRIRLEAIRLSTSFPFGLVAANRRIEQAASLIVWPARGRLTAPLLPTGEDKTTWPVPSLRAGGQDEFYGLREYRLGDNPRWIHWRRSAARAEPVVREMSRPRPRTLWVVLDTCLVDRSAEALARREQAIRFAATLIDDALADGYSVGAALAYSRRVAVIPPAGRGPQRQRLLDALADIDDNAARPLAETAAALRAGAIRHAHVVVVDASTRGEPLAGEALRRLRRVSRSLAVVTPDRLAELFVDDPLAVGWEDPPCP